MYYVGSMWWYKPAFEIECIQSIQCTSVNPYHISEVTARNDILLRRNFAPQQTLIERLMFVATADVPKYVLIAFVAMKSCNGVYPALYSIKSKCNLISWLELTGEVLAICCISLLATRRLDKGWRNGQMYTHGRRINCSLYVCVLVA